MKPRRKYQILVAIIALLLNACAGELKLPPDFDSTMSYYDLASQHDLKVVDGQALSDLKKPHDKYIPSDMDPCWKYTPGSYPWGCSSSTKVIEYGVFPNLQPGSPWVYMPNCAIAKVGGSITFKGHQSTNDFYFYPMVQSCGPEQVLNASKGDQITFTFKKPGTYTFYNPQHGKPDGTGMAGTISVYAK